MYCTENIHKSRNPLRPFKNLRSSATKINADNWIKFLLHSLKRDDLAAHCRFHIESIRHNIDNSKRIASIQNLFTVVKLVYSLYVMFKRNCENYFKKWRYLQTFVHFEIRSIRKNPKKAFLKGALDDKHTFFENVLHKFALQNSFSKYLKHPQNKSKDKQI